jgi:hypothetical protein
MSTIDPIRECFDRLSDDVMLAPGHAAAVLAVSPKTLEDWRGQGIAPPVRSKLRDAKTSPVRYRVGDVRDYIRGIASTTSTAATAARQAAIEGLDEPPARPGRASRHATVSAFFANSTSRETWPFILAEPAGRPLDAVETMGTDTDGPV